MPPNEGNQSERRVHEIEFTHKLEELDHKVASLTKSVEALVSAWNTASGVVDFIKWLSKLITACGVVWAAFHFWGK